MNNNASGQLGRNAHLGRRSFIGLSAAAAGGLLAACSPPGSSRTNPSPGAQASQISTDLTGMSGSFAMRADQAPHWQVLVDAFAEENPDLGVDLVTEEFMALQQNGQRYLASGNPPDLLRFPTPGDSVRDGLLLNLDPYAQAYGWNDYPASQLTQWRIAEDGRERGSGSLYSLGLGFALVGVFYNKSLLAELGLEPATTYEDFVDQLAAAREAGITPLQGGTTMAVHLLQALMHANGAAKQVSDWVFNVPGASIVSDETIEAARTLATWAQDGTMSADALSIDDVETASRFTGGDGLYFVQGSWACAGFDQPMAGNVGFIPVPTGSDGLRFAASAPNSFVIPADAENPDLAAAFLNWTNTSETARNTFVQAAGLIPGGPSDAPMPDAAEGSVFNDALAAFEEVSADDGLVDFLANSTPGMMAGTLYPELGLLLAGRTEPEAFIDKLQSAYEDDLAG